jgi:hypothetical protein
MECAPKVTLATESALEGAGFEPSVPLNVLTVSEPPLVSSATFPASPSPTESPFRDRGTESSNPSLASSNSPGIPPIFGQPAYPVLYPKLSPIFVSLETAATVAPLSRALRAVFLSASIQAESGSVCYFERVYDRENPKRIYYLSMEFLIGRSLSNNVANLLLDPFVQRAAQQRHLDCGGGREPTPTSFGSFSAIPSSAWRRSISAQTSDAVIPISLHSTTRL